MSETPGRQLDDAILVAYLDGTLDAPGRADVEASAAALARVDVLRAELAALEGALARALCPDGEGLAAFLGGELDEAGERALGAHVAWCADCARELAEMRAFLRAGDEPVAAPSPAALRWRVARALGRAAAGAIGSLALPQAGLRGAAGGPRTFEAGGWRVAVSVAGDRAHAGRAVASVLVLAPDDAPDGELEGRAVVLVDADGAAREAALDALGEARFDDLAPGVYSLLLDTGGAERLLVPGIDIAS